MAQQPRFTNFDQRIEAMAIEVGQHRLHPIVRVQGWQIAAGNDAFQAALGRAMPQSMLVQQGEQEFTLSITDPQREVMRGLVAGALAVSLFCLLITFVANRVASRRRTPR